MRKVALIIYLVVLVSGCATVPKKDYTKFQSADPHSILIIPVINRSVNVDAPDYFLSSIAIPIAEQGYYVFPVHMIKRVLEDDGLSDADMVHNAPTEKLASLFGADVVLYVAIERWDARYVLLSTTLTVQLKYVIKEGKTGEVLWEDVRSVQYSPSSSSSGNIFADLVVMAVTAAIEKAAPNYMPLARQANAATFKYPGPGIPPGPYLRKEAQVDQTRKISKKNLKSSEKAPGAVRHFDKTSYLVDPDCSGKQNDSVNPVQPSEQKEDKKVSEQPAKSTTNFNGGSVNKE